MKLELKHLSPYLPYNLNVKWGSDTLTLIRCDKYNCDVYPNEDTHLINGLFNTSIVNIKPILRPLSDLRKDEYIDELFMVYGGGFANKEAFLNTKFIDGIIYSDYTSYTYSLITYLLENHFDVFGLIENNLAIDINTL